MYKVSLQKELASELFIYVCYCHLCYKLQPIFSFWPVDHISTHVWMEIKFLCVKPTLRQNMNPTQKHYIIIAHQAQVPYIFSIRHALSGGTDEVPIYSIINCTAQHTGAMWIVETRDLGGWLWLLIFKLFFSTNICFLYFQLY